MISLNISAEPYWWMNLEVVKIILICVLIVAIPIIVWTALRLRSVKHEIEKLFNIVECENCHQKELPLGILNFHRYEGYFLNIAKEYHEDKVLCEKCTIQLLKFGRRRVLLTFWRSFTGLFLIIITFYNSYRALKEYKRTQELKITANNDH